MEFVRHDLQVAQDQRRVNWLLSTVEHLTKQDAVRQFEPRENDTVDFLLPPLLGLIVSSLTVHEPEVPGTVVPAADDQRVDDASQDIIRLMDRLLAFLVPLRI